MTMSEACYLYACRACHSDTCDHECHSDLAQGKAAKDNGMTRVAANANPEWKKTATQLMVHLTNTSPEWKTDQVWDLLETHYPHLSTPNPAVMGSLVNALARAGLIEKVRYDLTTRPEGHARPIAVWRKKV